MTAGPLVFIHPSDELYGADRMLLELVGAVPNSVDFEVWLPTDLRHPDAPLCVELERRGVRVRHLDLPILRRAYRTPRALAALAVKAWRISRELRRLSPSVVYCTTSAAYLGIQSARWARVPEVIGHVQEFWSSTDRFVLGPLARRSDRLIAISEAVATALPPAVQRRTVVVPNATLDPGPFESLAGRTGPLHYVVASRWNGWKGHRTLFAAWEQAGCPGRLTVLGAAPPSGEVVDVAALAARLSCPDSVEIVGEVPDPYGHIAAADVMIVPSDEPEPFGLVAIEAFARGRPVVASAAGGLAEIVVDHENGWLFPPKDASALAALLMSLTRDEATRAGAAARLRYESAYSIGRYGDQWRDAVFASSTVGS